jgi:hypothetical protein
MIIRRVATAFIGTQHRATLVPVHDTFIPIHSGGSCAGLGHLPERPPQLQGDAKELQRLIDALQPVVQAELGAAEPVGAWLRALEVSRDEATLVLAKELGCRGRVVSMAAFDRLKTLLHDTDIFVRFEPG